MQTATLISQDLILTSADYVRNTVEKERYQDIRFILKPWSKDKK